ncbi:MAG TPA: hypothetical protein VD905_19890 [Flavobacteriales bacterium]|nr:hypothetical protein [Flavobacteriales bacterium]
MKKIVLNILLLAVAFAATGQSSSLKPVIKNNKSSFAINGTTSKTIFQLVASDKEIQDLKKQAATMSNIKLSVNKQKTGTHTCELSINDRNDALYVQRIFSVFGFTNFIMDGAEKPVTELAATLIKLK